LCQRRADRAFDIAGGKVMALHRLRIERFEHAAGGIAGVRVPVRVMWLPRESTTTFSRRSMIARFWP
jgi:hypothetical protein